MLYKYKKSYNNYIFIKLISGTRIEAWAGARTGRAEGGWSHSSHWCLIRFSIKHFWSHPSHCHTTGWFTVLGLTHISQWFVFKIAQRLAMVQHLDFLGARHANIYRSTLDSQAFRQFVGLTVVATYICFAVIVHISRTVVYSLVYNFFDFLAGHFFFHIVAGWVVGSF